jgi:N4-gp56 family major capsid protein
MASTAGTLSYQDYKDNIAKTMLSDQVRMVNMTSTAFRVTAKLEPKFGAHKGQTVAIEKWQKLTQNTSTISEYAELPLKKPTINEVTITMNEYGNGVAYTEKAKTVAEYMLDSEIRRLIEINSTESMDAVVGAVAQTSDVFYTPTGTTSSGGTFDKDGTVTATATRDLRAFDFLDIAAQLRADNISKYDGQYYLAICNPFAMRALFNDPSDAVGASNIEILKWADPQANLKGELGMGYGFRFIEETNVLSSGIGGTAYNGECIILGDDAICEAMAIPETVETESHNFGRFLAIAWRTLTGFSKVWTNSTDGQYAIVRIHDAT